MCNKNHLSAVLSVTPCMFHRKLMDNQLLIMRI